MEGRQLPFTSRDATLLELEFNGELTASSASYPKNLIRAQLMYAIGQLNGEPGVAQLSKLSTSGITTAWVSGLARVRYHAKLPVVWGSKTSLPSSYALVVPRRVDTTGQTRFTTTYGQVCNDGEDDSVMVSNFWFHYRPRAPGCSLAPADVVTMTATVRVSALNRSNTYPEYHRVWEDGALDVVAVFAKYAAGATATTDAGIEAYNRFVQALRVEYPDAQTTPAALPALPGPQITDVTFRVTRPQGRVTVVALLIDSVTSAGAAFDKRYGQLTPSADLILYNGHAGLGANVAALAQKGKFFPGKYQIIFMNGCDTFAYVDGTLATRRAALNPDDPTGTKYLDTVANAMPAYFNSLPNASMAFIRGLAAGETAPRTYEQIFDGVDGVQIAVVTGEEDNVFTPTYDPGVTWNGFAASGDVAYQQTIRYETDVLAPGKYVFEMTHDQTATSGDADLRVRIGAEPTLTSTYKCPSYTANSNERCVVTVTAPSKVYLAATGDASSTRSRYFVSGFQLAR
jgi:hypothetical protein